MTIPVATPVRVSVQVDVRPLVLRMVVDIPVLATAEESVTMFAKIRATTIVLVQVRNSFWSPE